MKIGILGASGRMGQAVLSAAQESAVAVGATVVSASSAVLGDANNVGSTYIKLEQLAATQVEVLIDFSLPTALKDNLEQAQAMRCPIVVCTTGLSGEQQQLLANAAQHIPVLYAANTSTGVALLQQLVSLASAALPQADIEIIEAHHSAKRDAPSGTALALGASAAAGRGSQLADLSAGIRGDQEREPGSIGFAVIRAADIIGEHTVMLGQTGERIELTHKVSDRRVFALGALRAAQWLERQEKGLYTMADTLDLKTLYKHIFD